MAVATGHPVVSRRIVCTRCYNLQAIDRRSPRRITSLSAVYRRASLLHRIASRRRRLVDQSHGSPGIPSIRQQLMHCV